MAITGLLRLEKKLALGLGRRHQYTHTSTEAVQHTEVGAFQLSFPRWSSTCSHICLLFSGIHLTHFSWNFRFYINCQSSDSGERKKGKKKRMQEKKN